MRERKRSASREARRLRVEARRKRRIEQEALRREAEAHAAATRAALARKRESPEQAVERLLCSGAEGPSTQRLRQLLTVVADLSPRLVDQDTLGALKLLAEANWVRPPAEWRPSGKSQDRLFRSLAEHLLARYRVPPFVWSAFRAGADAPILAGVVTHVAAGGSLYEAVKSGRMPVPLTRAMCHELLVRGGEARFLHAVRKVQVRAVGGGLGLFRAWVTTRIGGCLHSREDEEFWQTVLAWFAANPMLPQAEVAPLVDYIEHRRTASPAFSMKGRSVLAVLRGMREWHGELAHEGVVRRDYEPSGLLPLDLDRSRRHGLGGRRTEVWHFREVLDSRTLADEGRAMDSCVYSYGRWIEYGRCSIWTATLRDDEGHWRRLTIEVRSQERRVVQARGRFNQLPEPKDMLALEAWAAHNNLKVALERW